MAGALRRPVGPLSGRRVAVVGAGWAGLATAVALVEREARVTVLEAGPLVGGRARSDSADPEAFDNGQHILIGAYTRTLDLLRRTGTLPEDVLWRCPLSLRHADGTGLTLPEGWPPLAFARAIMGFVGLSWGERAAMLREAIRWSLAGFECGGEMTVATLCQPLPQAVRVRLIDPLCVAALNTPADKASARVFLRVIKDSMFGGQGSSDLLLPRRPLAELLPVPAVSWLGQQGARVETVHRARELTREGAAWDLDGQRYDGVVLACGARESARLARPFDSHWSARAEAMQYEPIVTIYVRAPAARLPAPMTALFDGPDHPAQFVFDHGAVGGTPGRHAFVISGAARWVEAGSSATADATLRQAREQLGSARWPAGASVESFRAERRATFSCTPGLQRPSTQVAPGLVAAGDHVEGPYPATLEGAVRSADLAVAALVAALG